MIRVKWFGKGVCLVHRPLPREFILFGAVPGKSGGKEAFQRGPEYLYWALYGNRIKHSYVCPPMFVTELTAVGSKTHQKRRRERWCFRLSFFGRVVKSA